MDKVMWAPILFVALVSVAGVATFFGMKTLLSWSFPVVRKDK